MKVKGGSPLEVTYNTSQPYKSNQACNPRELLCMRYTEITYLFALLVDMKKACPFYYFMPGCNRTKGKRSLYFHIEWAGKTGVFILLACAQVSWAEHVQVCSSRQTQH